jgi:hypothetical protein
MSIIVGMLQYSSDRIAIVALHHSGPSIERFFKAHLRRGVTF